MVASEISGGQPINRPEHLGKQARRVKRLTGRSAWFNKTSTSQVKEKSVLQKPKRPGKLNLTPANVQNIPPETDLFVPFTPESGLKREIQAAEQEFNKNGHAKVKIVETLGPKLTH